MRTHRLCGLLQRVSDIEDPPPPFFFKLHTHLSICVEKCTYICSIARGKVTRRIFFAFLDFWKMYMCSEKCINIGKMYKYSEKCININISCKAHLYRDDKIIHVYLCFREYLYINHLCDSLQGWQKVACMYICVHKYVCACIHLQI